jgi:hypothetical protein
MEILPASARETQNRFQHGSKHYPLRLSRARKLFE